MTEPTLWTDDELRRFLQVRQEFFLDPMGSNKERFVQAAKLLQQALFDWYTTAPGKFEGMLALVTAHAEEWSQLRKEERRTLEQRRFALNNAVADTPAVESSVSENQWQRIFGSLGFGLSDPGTFDRFLVQLDEETNPSLRVNHRYLGELLPHDNMISYLSSVLATFLNENAIIGKVSPCVTHMEEAAIRWLLTLVGWDGLWSIDRNAELLPLQRLPIPPSPNHRYQRWERDEPTGTVVAGGTLANISALVIARNAVFDYLLHWEGAVQFLGPMVAWELVQQIWGYERLVVVTSLGAHYSVKKAALQAGVAPANVIEIAGSENPYVLDGKAFRDAMESAKDIGPTDLIVAVVPIAGKTETGYVDDVAAIASALDAYAAVKKPSKPGPKALPAYPDVRGRVKSHAKPIREAIKRNFRKPGPILRQFDVTLSAAQKPDSIANVYGERAQSGNNEIENARHNRLFLHVDAAHGGGYLTVPELRHGVFAGIEHADTITIDGHKSLYCYYPCGGLLIRATRWARTLSAGQTDYISEETNYEAYRESVQHFRERREDAEKKEKKKLLPHQLEVSQTSMYRLVALQAMTGRSLPTERSELTHQPFNQYLEGSRGPQGIMQLYFNLATLGVRGYRSILGWTALLRRRCEEAISLGMSDVRLVTDTALPDELYGTSKLAAIAMTNPSRDTDTVEPQHKRRVMPVGGGRFLRLSAGSCNQVLMTYVPAREAKAIVSADMKYWKKSVDGKPRYLEVLDYLWRVNEHLWHEHIYANPNFTYYLGHTTHAVTLPRAIGRTQNDAARQRRLVGLYESWNAWLRPPASEDGPSPATPFLAALAEQALAEEKKALAEEEKEKPGTEPAIPLKFFCHKIIVMHPYTDETLLGDMLRRVAFWGERSVADVRISDEIAGLIG